MLAVSRCLIDTLYSCVYSPHGTGEEKKVYCSMLGKLYISKHADVEKIRTVHELASQTVEVNSSFNYTESV